MEKLEKIKKWAEDNGYEVDVIFAPNIVELKKTIKIKDVWVATQYINIDNERIDSIITHRDYSENKEYLESLFIPLNNVKRDEKLLRQYLEQDEPHTPTLDEKKDLFREEAE